jgi:hypothetical protein
MGLPNPYFRICRPFVDMEYLRTIDSTYLLDSRYAPDRVDLIRGYHLLEKQLLRIFDYVEPADSNRACFSHELYVLLLRACTEFEANAKGILAANGYARAGNWNVTDYYLLNPATKLSEYIVSLPIWSGVDKTIKPFAEWSAGRSLSWYQHYNTVKHNRAAGFASASLENVVTAVAAVFVIVFSQFNIFAFDPHHIVSSHSSDDNVLSHDSSILHVKLPSTWTVDECYDFDWDTLEKGANPFRNYAF